MLWTFGAGRSNAAVNGTVLHGRGSLNLPRSSYHQFVSFILGRANASPSNTQGGSPVRESRPPGSVRGVLSNGHPYRDRLRRDSEWSETALLDAFEVSASARNRPEFQRMLDQIRDGDVLVVWKLDRLHALPEICLRPWRRFGKPAASSNRYLSHGPIRPLRVNFCTDAAGTPCCAISWRPLSAVPNGAKISHI